MLDQTEVKNGLDAIQIAALRKADCVCFYHRPKPDASGETSYICAIKEHKQNAGDPFAQDASLIIPCEWRLRDYSRSQQAIPYNSDAFTAFVSVSSYDETWKTTAGLLRFGDQLTLYWSRGGWNTEAMQNAVPSFYGDVLYLDVQRGKQRLTFHIDTCICEDNSARMIRRA